MILAVTKLPPGPETLAAVADASGVALPDVRIRLAGAMPRVLMQEPGAEKLRAVQTGLGNAGVHSVFVDPAEVSSDKDRLIVRRLEREGNTLVAYSGLITETRHVIPAGSIQLLQRGLRTHQTDQTVTTKEGKLDIKRAIATGGMLIMKSVTTSTTETSVSKEGFILVHRTKGEPDLILYESKLDYRFLGTEIQPARFVNLQKTVGWLQSFAPGVPALEKLLDPALVRGLPPLPADPVDVLLEILYLDYQSENTKVEMVDL